MCYLNAIHKLKCVSVSSLIQFQEHTVEQETLSQLSGLKSVPKFRFCLKFQLDLHVSSLSAGEVTVAGSRP